MFRLIPARPRPSRARLTLVALLAVAGPGIVSGFADNDAGGITTYSIAGATFGYDLLWVLLVSQLALMVTQEAGARLGLATGHGLSGLIREQYGVRWATLAVLTMLAANLGETVAEFAGIGAALDLFGIPIQLSDALIAAFAMVILLARANYRRIQVSFFVVVGIAVSIAYAVSAVLARPDWGRAAVSLVIPHGDFTNAAYILTVIGVVGTTITPWGQSFIQSYVVDKGLTARDLPGSPDRRHRRVIPDEPCRSIHRHRLRGHPVDPRDRDQRRGRCGQGPGATGWAGRHRTLCLRAPGGVAAWAGDRPADQRLRRLRGVRLGRQPRPALVGCPGVLRTPRLLRRICCVLHPIPGLPLIAVLFFSQVFDGLLLPIILVFVMLLARNPRVMGELRSGRRAMLLGWSVTVGIGLLSVALVISQVV